VVVAPTATVLTVKVAVLRPAGTVTLAGTVAAVFTVDRVISAPSGGAAPLKVTVAVEDAWPTTVAGLRAIELRAAGVTVRFALLVTPEYAADTAPVALAVTPEVVTANVALVAPAGITTLAGTTAAGLVSERVIVAPPGGARPVRVTVAVELLPPTTEVGFRVKVDSAAGFTVSTAVFTPFRVAEMLTGVVAETPLVVTVNVPVVAPAAIVMAAGVLAAAVLLEDRATDIPPVGADAFKVTVAVLLAPETTVVGVNTKVETTMGLIVSTADLTPLSVAVIVAAVLIDTSDVVTLNVPVVAPAANVIEAGTVAAGLSDANGTVSPPAGAGKLKVRVPTLVPLENTVVGFSVKLERGAGVTVNPAVFTTS